ncbi:ubiquitin carboxyl-terminal hydrolase [Anaeramoeba ignava]|uniref:Ubiquitin carboxyl-terminal hydrolase n=1 Tax=Anaeramoeba ignava TaxID=1746090 RepID=A0A9Q0LUT3_ANAIG|nr:ubiquitin carboxyl-terminal hydrolase [Anaeramoeba ignava]
MFCIIRSEDLQFIIDLSEIKSMEGLKKEIYDNFKLNKDQDELEIYFKKAMEKCEYTEDRTNRAQNENENDEKKMWSKYVINSDLTLDTLRSLLKKSNKMIYQEEGKCIIFINNIKKEKHLILSPKLKNEIRKHKFFEINKNEKGVFCEICELQIHPNSCDKIDRHVTSKRHKRNYSLMCVKNDKKMQSLIGKNLTEKIKRIYNLFTTVCSSDFFSIKNHVLFRTGLTKERLWNILTEDGLDLRIPYKEFCHITKHFFCFKAGESLFFHCPLCSGPNAKKHRMRVESMKKLYNTKIEDPNTLVVILDFSVNIQERRDKWETPEFYTSKSWILLNATLMLDKIQYLDFITNDNHKDQQMVYFILGKLQESIMEKIKNQEIGQKEKICFFSDGGNHLHNNVVISRIINLFYPHFKDIEIFFFEAYHGKSACDRHFGLISRQKKSFGDILSLKDLDIFLSGLNNTSCFPMEIDRSKLITVDFKIKDFKKYHCWHFENGKLFGRETSYSDPVEIKIPSILFQTRKFIWDLTDNKDQILHNSQQNVPLEGDNFNSINSLSKTQEPKSTLRRTKNKRKKGNLKRSEEKKILKSKTSNPKNQVTDEVSQLKGFQNIGNTCFLSSVFQCLLRTQFSQIQSIGSLSQSIFNLFSQTSLLFDPTQFFDVFHKLSPTFHLGNQEDAHLFLTQLFFQLNQEIKRLSKEMMESKTNCNQESISNENENLQRNVRVNQLILGQFVSQIQTTIKCSQCKGIKENIEPFLTIVLPLTQCRHQVNLTYLIDSYFSKSRLKKQDQVFCSSCDEKRNSDLQRKIITLPRYLIFFIQRIKFNPQTKKARKSHKMVEFPEILNLQHLISPELNLENGTFNLLGLVHHFGTPNSGHYYSVCREFSPLLSAYQWFLFDDDEVTEAYFPLQPSSSVVLLFYERRHEKLRDCNQTLLSLQLDIIFILSIFFYIIYINFLSKSRITFIKKLQPNVTQSST